MPLRSRKPLIAAVLVTIAASLAACGSGSEPSSSGPRTIEIEMRDVAFAPKQIAVPAGQEVTLVFRNKGKVPHDAYVGDADAQEQHEMEMARATSDDMGGMEHGSGDEDAITVEPGRTGELTRTFERGDSVLVGCHQKGHYAAGMKMTVDAT